ncbi:MAG TPA: family 43 glycosylhydrolase [Bacteroidota bacterium]|nr:family 43 glycosylhydrolase [Bacteroidota bacterium]
MRRFSITLALALLSSALRAQEPAQRTYCNPLDIDYKYDAEEMAKGISYRSGADPVIVPADGQYYLFVTNSGGYWRSPDLVHWTFVTPSEWPAEDMCAPAALMVRDTLYLFQSTFDRKPLYFSTDPSRGILRRFNPLLGQMPGALGPWDPDIFHDEASDRWFMYFGSSNTYPIYGIELDHARGLDYIGKAKELLFIHPEENGWERFGRDHRDTIRPYIEGSWMTQHHGVYYLQYAAPGTEYNVYANGTYVGGSPMGPFTYAPNNPVSYKPGGFMAGAGHGNTFEDNFGNYWNTGTPWVAVNGIFERRISMFPAGFDSDGVMFSNTRFGDFPHYLPTRKTLSREELFAGWMLLSYRKPCVASSAEEGYPSSNLTDENPRTFWVARSSAPGEYATVDLKHPCTVRAVQVNYTDYKAGVFKRDSTIFSQFRLSCSSDNKNWKLLADLSQEKRDRPNAYLELYEPVVTRYVRFEHIRVSAAHLALCDIRIFGSGNGSPPETPLHLSARRATDVRNALVSWDEVPGAVGYNVLWGIAPGKLYETYQVFADAGTRLEIRALSAGVDYFFAVEAFNERGVSRESSVVHCQ